jgi:hypothetical protein
VNGRKLVLLLATSAKAFRVDRSRHDLHHSRFPRDQENMLFGMVIINHQMLLTGVVVPDGHSAACVTECAAGKGECSSGALVVCEMAIHVFDLAQSAQASVAAKCS